MISQDTAIERRMLAHEQILQALIAHMVETHPEFLERLSATFGRPVRLASALHDYTDTSDYAAAFVREIIKLGESPERQEGLSLVAKWDDLWPTRGESNLINENAPVRFEIFHREGVWEVLRDGQLIGGYVHHTGAREAALAGVQRMFEEGRAAEIWPPFNKSTDPRLYSN
ncbi:hypothetical protein [Asticcacaulis sp.]|uniref:hypothetical protein n=1 Tax=Asticcacaulis sp. TaxID=1872648 RepID=UPI00261EB4EF|nr:hypothetical protein [Asticcacaulis sp.]